MDTEDLEDLEDLEEGGPIPYGLTREAWRELARQLITEAPPRAESEPDVRDILED